MPNTQGAEALQGAVAPSNRWVADVRKNSREVLRVELTTFKGVELVNLRVWFDADRGEMRPGKSGFALKVEKLLDLQDAIGKAIEAARAEGTI